MAGKVEDGDMVAVEPLGDRALRTGDIVLARVHGREYLHLVKAIKADRYLIGNQGGGINGWGGRQGSPASRWASRLGDPWRLGR